MGIWVTYPSVAGLMDAKNWLTAKDPDAGKDWRREEKGTTEDEMVRWHHWLNAHEFEEAPGVGDGQGSLVCYSPWGCKDLDMTEQLNWTELVTKLYTCNLIFTYVTTCMLALNFKKPTK